MPPCVCVHDCMQSASCWATRVGTPLRMSRAWSVASGQPMFGPVLAGQRPCACGLRKHVLSASESWCARSVFVFFRPCA